MNIPVWSRPIPLLVLLTACGGSSPSPTTPSASTFLAGTWRGTLTIEVNPGDSNALPPSSGPMQWTFEVVSQTTCNRSGQPFVQNTPG